MINPIYGVECLKRGLIRYIKQSKIVAQLRCSNTSISIYVDANTTGNTISARISNHHPKLQNFANTGIYDITSEIVSIEFIAINSPEDKQTYRGRVYQNLSGTIQPFDVTTYQYNSDMLNLEDLAEIFKAIIVFLNGGGYIDPFQT